MENNNEVLPQDVQNEILLRLPVKSLGKCICVSKKWAALILDKYFRDRYNFLQSTTRPRLLFMLSQREDIANVLFRFRRNPYVFFQRDDPNVLFHSVYQEKEPLLSSCQQQTYITLEPQSHVWAILRGLVCIISPYKILLCNLSTKKFLALPEITELYEYCYVAFNAAYLGYDEGLNVFKVLCLTTKKFDNNSMMDFRVFTVGSGEYCWRKIVYKFEHLPVTKGICKDGVLYYGAESISDNVPIVISFNLRSEELNVIELPMRVETMIGSSLVNYKREIALVNGFVNENGEIKIWVRNEAAGDWREEHIVIPSWRETVGEDWCKSFRFKGTIGRGEVLVFTRVGYIEGSMIVLYYDTITQRLRKFEIDGVANEYVSTYLDHVDSLLLM